MYSLKSVLLQVFLTWKNMFASCVLNIESGLRSSRPKFQITLATKTNWYWTETASSSKKTLKTFKKLFLKWSTGYQMLDKVQQDAYCSTSVTNTWRRQFGHFVHQMITSGKGWTQNVVVFIVDNFADSGSPFDIVVDIFQHYSNNFCRQSKKFRQWVFRHAQITLASRGRP